MSLALPRLPVHRPLDARMKAELRKCLSLVIERLINELDALDADPDLEPSLGWTKTMAWGSTDDREEQTR